MWDSYRLRAVYLGPVAAASPLTDAFGRLKEASVVRLLEGLVGLRDEGWGPLDALFTAGYLLGELPQAHGLGTKWDILIDEKRSK